MKDDTISRHAAIRWIKTECNPYGKPTLDYETSCRIMEHLDKMPSSQPEIIRCAECKWFQCNMSMDGYLPKGVDEFECRHWCGSCDPVDFCRDAQGVNMPTNLNGSYRVHNVKEPARIIGRLRNELRNYVRD